MSRLVFRLVDLPNADLRREGFAPGWYYWPDEYKRSEGAPVGPFASEQEARDARC